MTERVMQRERRLRLGFGIDAMKQLKVCVCCGTVSHADQNQCLSCGAELPKETLYEFYRSRHRKCGHCHAVVSGDASFCPTCGRQLPKDPKTDETTNFDLR